MTPRANDRQIAGDHYKRFTIEPWDFVAANRLDAFQGSIIRYVCRWDGKDGVQALHKARHYLDKYIELIEAGYPNTAPEYFARMLVPNQVADVHPTVDAVKAAAGVLGDYLGVLAGWPEDFDDEPDELAASLQHLEDEQLAEPDRERIDPAAMCRSREYHRWERVNGVTECEDCGEKMTAALATPAAQSACPRHLWHFAPNQAVTCSLCGALWDGSDRPGPWAPVDEPDAD